MKKLIEFKVDDTHTVFVEVEEGATLEGAQRVSRAGVLQDEACDTFQKAIERIRPAVDYMIGFLRDINELDEIEVTFGIKMDAKAGAFIASAGAEANFAVQLKWNKKV